MKNNKNLLLLATAMMVGAAGAQTTGTKADTLITNVATATYDNPAYDPADPASTPTIDTPSNEVVTRVLPKPDFDIVYTDLTDGTTANQALTDALPDDYEATTPAGGTIDEVYIVQNTGNTDQVIDLTSNTVAYDEAGNVITAAQTVEYFLDADGDGVPDDTNGDGNPDPITSVTLASGEDVQIIQRVTTPSDATPGDQYVTSPVGTGDRYDDATSTVLTDTVEPAADDLQFSEITIYTPVLDNTPEGGESTTPTPADPVTPPPGVNVPTAPLDPTDPTSPIVPTTPDGDPIVTIIDGDEQLQNAPYSETPSTAIFGNQLTNNGTVDDPITLTVTDPNTGNPATYDPTTGEFTFVDPQTGEPVTVTLYDENGNPLTGGTDGPTLTVPAGTTVPYTTVVDYPATHDTNGDPLLTENLPIQIGADSGLDGDTTPDNYTTDTLVFGDAEFGNDDGDNANADPTPTDEQFTTPGGTTQTPKDIANTGDYPDSYTVKGYTEIELTDGTTVLVPVTYPELTVVGTEDITVTKADGTTETVTVNVYETPVLQPGEEASFNATVVVPADAAAGTYTLTQTAEGEYSGQVMTDNNDEITISPVGDVALAKFQQGAPAPTTVNGVDAPTGYGAGEDAALPGEVINYAIVAKNNYNTEVANFRVCDSVPTNTTFNSVAGNGTGPFIYSTDGGVTWGAAPTTLATGAEVCVAIDADPADGSPDALGAGETFRVDFNVTIN